MSKNKEALDRIRKCRSNLVLTNPFFASLLLTQELVENNSVPTMGTDGKHLHYNPDFVATLEEKDLRFVLAHEAFHVGFGHPYRLYGRHHGIWNCAGDYCINRFLTQCGFEMPSKLDEEGKQIPYGIIDQTGEYRGMHEDQIYNKLLEKAEKIYITVGYDQDGPNAPGQDQDGQQGGSGQGKGNKKHDPHKDGCGGLIIPKNKEGKPMSREEASAAAREQQATLAAAAMAAKAVGKLPAELERLIDAQLNPTVPWQDVLRRFIETAAKNDYSFRHPNLRLASATGGRFFFPSLYSNELGHLVIAVDTSGSISQEELKLFCSELNAILEICQPTEVTVIYCDAEVNNVETFYPEDLPVKMNAKGGGGTDFRPPFTYVEKESIEPRAFLYLTDMCCHSFPEEPEYPVLWCGTGQFAEQHQEVPFGEVVLMGNSSSEDRI